MSLDTVETANLTPATRMGTVLAIAYSKELINGVGKEVRSGADVTILGIEGDKHYGETRYSSSQRKVVPNLRPITVVGVEATRAACEALGLPEDTVPAGGLGENILTEGLGDLSDLAEGDRMEFLDRSGEPKLVLNIEGQNPPCSSLMIYHKQMVKQLINRRGLLCTVAQPGHIEVGDTVRVIKA